MLAYLVRFFFGVVILLLSTHIFVKLSVKLSQVFRVSPLVIGMIVVSFGTTLPELSVSLMSSRTGNIGLASGTIVGSTIANIVLVFPAAILLGESIRIGTTKTQRNGVLLLASVLFFIVMQNLKIPTLLSGTLLLIGLFTVMYLEYKWGIIGRVQEDKNVVDLFKKQKVTPDLIFGIISSIIGVTIGGILVVNSMEDLALISGYSTTVLGLTLTGVAASLPDLFTAITSQKRDEDKLTIGQVIGGSLYNLLFIGGVTNLAGGDMEIGKTETAFLVAVVVVFFLILKFYKGKDIPRWVGLLLILIFVIYIYVVSFL